MVVLSTNRSYRQPVSYQMLWRMKLCILKIWVESDHLQSLLVMSKFTVYKSR